MKGPREPSHFVLPFGNGDRENREKRRRKQEEKKVKREKAGGMVETMGKWPRAAVAGRQVESEIQKHKARSVENERHLRKSHVEVATNQKFERQSMETREGTEAG